MKVSMFISTLLTYGIRLYPFEQERIFCANQRFSIPDNELALFNRDEMEEYVKALDYATREDSRDWSAGFDMLEIIGFKKEETKVGCRSYVNMVWDKKRI